MKKALIAAVVLSPFYSAQAQSWTKVSSNFDSLWTSSVRYFNKGDTILYYGSKTGTGSFDAKRFYVSTNGGKTFVRDTTALDAIGFTPIFALPINNLLIGFKNNPNSGAFSFQGVNSWTSLLPLGLGIYGEVKAGTLLWNSGSGSTTLQTMTTSGSDLKAVASGSAGIDLICSYNKGTRLFLGGGSSNAIKYVDNGDFANIKTSTIESQGIGSDVVRFFEAGSSLYAVVDAGTNKLFKSTDDGATWTLVNTTYEANGKTSTLKSAFTLGTPNGDIFFLESNSGTSESVFLSKDGGATASKIPNGLPTNGLRIGPTTGKLLTSGNKVWYQVCAANTVDFVRTDTAIAGLYAFSAGSTTSSKRNIRSDELLVHQDVVSGRISIQGPASMSRYRISDLTGRTIQSGDLASGSIGIRNLEAGAYFLTVTTSASHSLSRMFLKK
jgi:hypothetical protein